MFIINPGTEPQANPTVENAIEATRRFCKALNMNATFERDAKRDGGDGWYGFIVKANGKEIEIDVPGVDPDITEKGIPFTSPRLYVDGSSWLWGYALDAASERLEGGRMTNPFLRYTRLNPETGKREWLPDTPDYIKVAARGFKAERLKNANSGDQPAAPGADQALQA